MKLQLQQGVRCVVLITKSLKGTHLSIVTIRSLTPSLRSNLTVTTAAGGKTATVNSVVSSGGGRVYTFSVTIPALADQDAYTASIAAGTSYSLSGLYLTGASNIVAVTVSVVRGGTELKRAQQQNPTPLFS